MNARPYCPSWCTAAHSEEGPRHSHEMYSEDGSVTILDIADGPVIDLDVNDLTVRYDVGRAAGTAELLDALGHDDLAELIRDACNLIDPPKSESPGAATPELSDNPNPCKED